MSLMALSESTSQPITSMYFCVVAMPLYRNKNPGFCNVLRKKLWRLGWAFRDSRALQSSVPAQEVLPSSPHATVHQEIEPSILQSTSGTSSEGLEPRHPTQSNCWDLARQLTTRVLLADTPSPKGLATHHIEFEERSQHESGPLSLHGLSSKRLRQH